MSDSEEEQKLKLCIGCNIRKPLSEYWLAVRGVHERYSRCKKCHTILRKTKPEKTLGFAALDIETQKEIVQMLKDKKKLKHIAKQFDISYTTFYGWCKKGKCVLTKEYNTV